MSFEIGQHLSIGLFNQGNTIHPILVVEITFTDQKHWLDSILYQCRQLRQ